MKQSEKLTIPSGILFLFAAAIILISIFLQFLNFGSFRTFPLSSLYNFGRMLFSVYGYSSFLIPIFLLVAAIMLFLPNWSTARGVYLLISVIPFFTIAGLEHVSKIILTDITLPMKVMKYTAVIFISALLVSIEYLVAGLIIDAVLSRKAKKSAYIPVFEVNDEGNPVPEEILTKTGSTIKESEDESVAESDNSADAQDEADISDDYDELDDDELQDDSESSYVKKERVAPNIGEIDISDIAASEENFKPVVKKPAETFGTVAPAADETSANKAASKKEEPPTPEEVKAGELKQPDKVPQAQINELSSIVPGFTDQADAEAKSGDNAGVTETVSESAKGAADVEEPADAGEPASEATKDAESAEPASDMEAVAKPTADVAEPAQIAAQAEPAAAESPAQIAEPAEENVAQAADTETTESANGAQVAEVTEPVAKSAEPASEPVAQTADVAEPKPEPEIITIDFDAGKKPEPEIITLDFNSGDAPELKLLEKDEPKSSPKVSIDAFDSVKSEKTAEPSSIDEDIESDVPIGSATAEEKDVPISGVSAEDFYSPEEEAFFLDPFADEASADSGADAEPVETEKAYKPADTPATTKYKSYHIPTEGLLNSFENNPYWIIDEETRQAGTVLKETLSEFKIEAEITGIRKGPVITMFEILPAPGVRLNKIVALQDNIALRLAAASVRIVAPIPGKQAVGVEIPNRERAMVSFRELIEKDLPAFNKMQIPVVLGKDITGEAQMLDLTATPHLLIAGSTGSGKSVCVNSIILSILYKRSPRDVKMILIDPKVVELKLYNDIPHLLTPVITEPKKAFQALQYCLCEMERRYAMLDRMGVRDIKTYNRRIDERQVVQEKLPYIVVIIDEFADLMATTGKELENTVARLAAMSRAVGIHLVLATQRPSIDVITGLIKANIPTRIAFMVASKTDSRIIIDQVGAEKLLGKGDMLYASAIDPFPVRIQGTFVTEDEVENVVDYVKQFGPPDYIDDEIFVEDEDDEEGESQGDTLFTEGEDPLYEQALDIVVQAGKASASYIQRRLKIGYNRAARLVEEMEDRGIVGPANGAKPRELIHIP